MTVFWYPNAHFQSEMISARETNFGYLQQIENLQQPISMYQATCSPEELHLVLRSIAQAQARLRGMKIRQTLLPMQYCARLSWEALYEARQILRSPQQSAVGGARSQGASMETLSMTELGVIAPSIEQVMAELQAIETNTDLSAMQAAVQSCLQQLNDVATVLKQSMLVLQQ